MRVLWLIFLGAVSGALSQSSTAEYMLTLDVKADLILGSPNATYCKLSNNFGTVVYDKPGPCRLTTPKVKKELQGEWTAQVGMRGELKTEQKTFVILIRSRPELYTNLHASSTSNSVTISCYFETNEEIQSCRFKSPRGDLLLVSPGDEDSKYSFGGKVNSDNNILNCGLQILKVDRRDFGIWRCAVKTNSDLFYSFVTLDKISLEKRNRNTNMLAPAIDPILKPLKRSINSVMTDEGFTIGCEISAALEQCFLRSPQGIVYNVSPGVTSNEFEYVGEGLDAGVCAIRIYTANMNETGKWNCTVGLQSLSYYNNPERTVEISVNIQGIDVQVKRNQNIVITLSISNWAREPMQHCRFFREDGFTITSRKSWIPGYTAAIDYVGAICVLTIDKPDFWDFKTWIASVKLDGYTHELTKAITINDSLPHITEVEGSCVVIYAILYLVVWMLLIALIIFTLVILVERIKTKYLRQQRFNVLDRIYEEMNLGNLPSEYRNVLRQYELSLLERINADSIMRYGLPDKVPLL